MLEGAATAHAEMGADGRDARGRRLKDREQLRMLTVGIGLDADTLPWQRKRHEERAVGPVGHAVALGAEPVDRDLKHHREPHDARR